MILSEACRSCSPPRQACDPWFRMLTNRPPTPSSSAAGRHPQFSSDRWRLYPPALPESFHLSRSGSSRGVGPGIRLCRCRIRAVTFPPQSLSRGNVTPIWSAKALLAKALSMLTPRTWVSASFQRFQILLEVFHLLRSTTGKREDIERQHHVLLAAVVAQLHFFLGRCRRSISV